MVISQESLHVNDLHLLGRDSGFCLTKDSEVMELKVRADLEGEGYLREVPPDAVHSDQHVMGPAGTDGQRALGGSLTDWVGL